MNHFRRILWLAAKAILDAHPLGTTITISSDTLTLLEFKGLFERIQKQKHTDMQHWLKVYAEAEKRGEV
jgi:hypothetical protein